MGGLGRIIDQIKTDSETKVAAIKGKATLEASELFTNTRLEADAEAQKIVDEGKTEAEKIIRKARSQAEFDKKQMILSEKQLLISHMFNETADYLKHVPDEIYFPLLKKLIKIHALENRDGELIFSESDYARLPASYEVLVNMELELKHSRLKISEKHADIDGGFILSYGGVEMDCSIDSLIRDARGELKGEVNRRLFE